MTDEQKIDHRNLILLGLCVAAIHILLNGKYGFHRDELDILMNARQLDWGYVAYPPFTPFIARIGLTLFGNSLQGLRLFSAIGQGISVILIGMMTKDMGGKRQAQLMAALAAAVAPLALTAGTMLQYLAFDYLWWVVISFCLVRIIQSEEPRWWLGFGAAVGMAMMTKFTAAFFIAGLATAILISSNRRYLRSAWLWVGVGLALLIYLPNLIWQIQHDFITLDFLKAIHARDIQWGRTDEFLSEQFLISTNPFTLPLWLYGLSLSLFAPRYARFKGLGIAFLVTFGLLWISRGRAYYVGPAYPMLFALGAVGWEEWLNRRGSRTQKSLQMVSWGILFIGAIVGIVLIKPVAPINSELWKITSEINGEVREMVGWEDLTAQVAAIYTQIPNEDKAHTVILAGNYGEAGAFDLYGAEYGLPPVISGTNSLWERGYGSFEPETIIVVGFERGYALQFFKSCSYTGQVTNRYGVLNEETTHHTGLYICSEPRRSWSEIWQEMQWFQ